ncbi:MAG TPA: L-histidine N(alpha)-methyltransferase [Allosphingosinicella sp.]|nr:L-histidine N(alpha)-methyltransferase [Allosphingosinicella sp.]
MDVPRSIAVDPDFRRDVLEGLAAPIRAIPARWLYDRRGSELFEAITALPEYYLTRTDTALLEAHSDDVARIAGTGPIVVEFGAGSAAKTPTLLRAIVPAAYVPIDISGEFLALTVASLRARFPGLLILPVEADFMGEIGLPRGLPDAPRLGFFPGSTIGNLVPGTAVDLLRRMKEALGPGARLLIGMDRVKDPDILLAAYDDEAGVTAEFNLNLLRRIDRELGGTIPLDAFRHRALWNDAMSRIEMHLEAMRDVAFTVEGISFAMKAGETIHTENSHKYSPRSAHLLLHAGGWTPLAEWSDAGGLFALILAESEAPRSAP